MRDDRREEYVCVASTRQQCEYIEEELIEVVPTTPPPWTEMASSLGTLLSQRTTTTETGRAGRCFTNCV